MPDPTDQLARECIDWLRDRALQVAPGQAEDTSDGFVWCPGPVQQTVRAVPIEGSEAVAVTVHTDVWALDGKPELEPAVLDFINDGSTLSAASADEQLALTSGLLVYPELVGWQLRFLSWVAAMQLAEAADLVAAEACGLPGSPFVSAGKGTAYDDLRFDEIVEVRDLLARASEDAAEHVQTEDVLERAAAVVGGSLSIAEGLHSAYVVERPWTVLPPEALTASFAGSPVKSFVTVATHPDVGPGFGIRSLFPLVVGNPARELCRRLNHPDLAWPCARVGPWLPLRDRIAVQTFLPAGMLAHDPAADLLGNVLSYHERMMRPALEELIDLEAEIEH